MRADLEAEKETISKAKDIVEQSKHIQQLDSENKILKQERKDMLKMHEDSMKALQDSASEEMNRSKEEITILKDQKKAANEQNQRHHEAYKIVRRERDSMAETLQQAETSIFTPMGLTRSPPPPKECMVLAGNFINTAIKEAKEIAKPLQININASDFVVKFSEILRRAPGRIASWKASCAREGARMVLSMVKAYYENANIDTVTFGIPNLDDEGQKINHESILASLVGYDTRVSELVDVNVFVPMKTIDGGNQSSFESHNTVDFEEGDSPATDDAASKSPALEE